MNGACLVVPLSLIPYTLYLIPYTPGCYYDRHKHCYLNFCEYILNDCFY